jgi:hypothetical protein
VPVSVSGGCLWVILHRDSIPFVVVYVVFIARHFVRVTTSIDTSVPPAIAIATTIEMISYRLIDIKITLGTRTES